MGRKESTPKSTNTDNEEIEDPPVIKKLKEIDDEYLAIEKEYEKEVAKILKKYNDLQKPLLDKRRDTLADKSQAEKDAADGNTGTPAVKGFWLEALSNHQQIADMIQPHDIPVLEYMKDVTYKYFDDEDPSTGFTLIFHFAENPYFTNEELTKEFYTTNNSPYRDDIDIEQIKCSEIEWKTGKDVTMALVTKKAKGGGAKKAKQKKEKEEAQPSFFRFFFCSLKSGEPAPELIMEMFGMGDEEEEEEGVEYLMEASHDLAVTIKDSVIPYAVRWYTGEAAPPMEDDDEDEEEESEMETDDEVTDDDEESSPRAGHKSKKKEVAAGAGEKKEECKQQ